MKKNLTVRIDVEAIDFLKSNKLNASILFETFVFKELMKKEFYIELSKRGNKVYENLVKLDKEEASKE